MDEDIGTAQTAPEVAPEAASPSTEEHGSGERGIRWGLWLGGAWWALVGLVVIAVAVLSQTQAGQRLVVDRVMDIARGELAGELVVEEIRSRTLFTGLTLTTVRLDAAGGRRFLAADSIVVRYSPLTLLFGSPRLRSTTIHGLALEISRYPHEDGLNVGRILADKPPKPDSAGAGRPTTLGLGRLSVRQGLIEVLTPVDDDSAPHTVEAPGGGLLRRIAFDLEDLDLEETMLRPGGAVTLDARLASLTTSISLLEHPLVVREAFGRLAFGARGLEVTDAAVRLPGTLARGSIRFGPERPGDAWTFRADLESEGWGELADLQWVEPRIPDGRFRGGATIRSTDVLDVDLRAFEVQLEASHLVANGNVRFGDVMVLRGLRVTANPLSAARLEPWIGRDLPIDGFLSGQVTFAGTAAELQATGRVTLIPAGLGGASTTADFSGTIHAGASPGATGLQLRLDPLNYRVLETLWPEARALGSGTARLEINGRAERGIRVAADVSVAPDAQSASRWVGTGVFTRESSGGWATDVSGDLTPLSLALLGRIWPELQLAGRVSGPMRASGPLSDLQVSGELAVGEGMLSFGGAFDLESFGAAYQLDAELEALRVSDLTERLPDPSVFTGAISIEGSGLRLDSAAARGSVVLRDSRVGPAGVPSATARVSFSEGVLTADTLDAVVSGAHVAGAGSMGTTEGTYGEAHLDFDLASLLELRPIFMGDSLLVRDELNPLELELLEVRGVDTDTLPGELDVRMAGSVRGRADVRGRFQDFELDLLFSMAEAAYAHDEVDSASVALSASGLPATFGDWVVDARAQGVSWAGRQFEQVDFGGRMSQRRGDGVLEVQRRRNERYFLAGAFAIDSVGGYADLTEASIQIADLSWLLRSPTRVAWTGSSLSVDSLDVVGVGDDPMLVSAGGTLTRGGDSDFELHMEGFHIEQALQIVQLEDIGLAGHIDLTLTVQGPAEQPVIDAVFEVEEPSYGSVRLTRLSGSLDYAERRSDFRIDGWSGDRNVVSAIGVLPFDLALTDVVERTTTEPMDVRVTADSLEAATALGYLSALQDVRGMMSADFRIRGSSRDPQPSGTVRLTEGAWTLEALGVRHTGVTGEVLLRPDRTLTVKLATTRSGTSSVTGTVLMDEIANPELDLVVSFDRFQAVSRRDMESTISGEFRLTGRYRLPVAEGTLRVDEGTLFVEEFARASGVVDLTDPMLYADGFAVDTTVFVSQPVLAGLRNPFLDNLRVDIDMSVPRDTWLRSSDMNVEMGGELLVRYDRPRGDLVLIGELQALRGSYLVLGRTFEVTGGTVAFIGQPGINPSLDIQARSRIRRRDNDPFEVQATVQGTLIQPLVSLSSEEAGLSQSDLISYLVFGRSSGELGAGGVGAGGLGQDLGAGTVTYFTGALANQVGAALAQGVGLDYLSIAQAGAFGTGQQGNVAENFVRNAQVEAGWYLNDDLFVILVFASPQRAASDEEGGGFSLRGVRLEWALTDNMFVEGFVEDRFLRSGTGGLGTSGLDGDQVLGAFVFREWGYGSQQ